jgi:hypothetical protein
MSEWNASEYHRESALQQTLADEHLAKVSLKRNERARS